MKPLVFAAAALAGVVSVTAACATPIEYQFSIKSVGAGTEMGTFYFDGTTDEESNVSITITGDSTPSVNGTYTQAGPGTPPADGLVSGKPFDDIIVGTDGHGDKTYIGFSTPLTPSGGVITMTGDTMLPAELSGVPLGNATQVAAPEPTSLALFGVGLIGLAAKRRRQDFSAGAKIN